MIRGMDRGTTLMTQGTLVRRLIYHGRVQGVGFRATTASLASGFAVSGYVRNQPEGTVELAVKGNLGEVDRFLASISEGFSANITRIEEFRETQPLVMKGFVVLP
jgi:acylphosphatase